MPEFSVIMPVYNVEKYIGRTLKSILGQTFEDFELICVNDCTPDNSMTIVNRCAQHDDRIKIITHAHNKGLGAARNTALNACSGKYIVCVDSDDWIDTTFLEKIHNIFEHENVDSVWVKHWIYYEEKDSAEIPLYFPALTHFPGGRCELTPKNIVHFPAYAWNKAYKNDIIKKNNFVWMENVFYEDVYFFFDYFINNPNVFIINEMLYYYRQRPDSITQRNDINTQKIKDMYQILEYVYELVQVQGYNPDYKQSVKIYADIYNAQWVNTKYENISGLAYEKFNTMCEI